MVVTEVDLRDQLRRPGLGDTVVVPVGARMSPSARDFINQWKLVVVEHAAGARGTTQRDWDKPSSFPVPKHIPASSCVDRSIPSTPSCCSSRDLPSMRELRRRVPTSDHSPRTAAN